MISDILKVAHHRAVRLKFTQQNFRDTMKDYYRLPEGYLLNPFDFLDENSDIPLSDNKAIRETIQGILDIEHDRLDLDLSYLEHLIQLDSLAYVRKGCVYATIKFKKLYKEGFSSFEKYSQMVLSKSVDAVNNAIEASRVCIELISAGFSYIDLPHNMSQAVQLKKYTGNKLIEKWHSVLEEIKPHKRTSESIKNLLHPPVVSEDMLYTTVKLPSEIYNKLLKVAYHAKLSIPEALDAVLFVLTNAIKKADILRLMRWILDMVDLAESGA